MEKIRFLFLMLLVAYFWLLASSCLIVDQLNKRRRKTGQSRKASKKIRTKKIGHFYFASEFATINSSLSSDSDLI